jgi:hypothetical protein
VQVRNSLDLRLRVFALTLEPALHLARALSLSLEDVEDTTRAMYVQMHRDQGLSLEQIARRIGTSRRTVATLSSRSSASQAPLEHSERIGVRRALIRLLSRGDSVSMASAREEVGVKDEVFHDELEVLIQERAVENTEGQLSLTRAWTSYEGGNEAERLDSLRHFLSAVGETVRRRFFAEATDDESFARVLSFSSTPDMIAILRKGVFQALCEGASEADEKATSHPDRLDVSVAFCVTRTG